MQNGKELWISRIHFPMENLVDRVHRARAHRCKPAAVEDEPDEAVLEGCSPEHEQQWRDGTMEAKNGGGLSVV
jgi:hypothetical protein